MKPHPIVYFGTPEFAVPPLEALVGADLVPALVVSQPARPAGRDRRLRQPPVARWAERHDIPLSQPERLSDPELQERLRALEPAVAAVVAFGQIFPPGLLELPSLGCVNVHASLLPRHRGAAPIQAAIAAGDEVTGVTTMLMDEGLDTGPILLRKETPIRPEERAGELAERLARLGGELLVETVEGLAEGAIEPLPQDDARATYARRLKKSDGRIDWTLSAEAIERRLRAYDPWPGCFTVWEDERIKVLDGSVMSDAEAARGVAPGTIVDLGSESVVVACGEGSALALTRVQRPGRSEVSGRDLANGLRLEVGDRFE
ncbi:MAG: methionyl-tRNA formyltransferase [Thermoanaerobaculia bacterium]|nr:methionyl-tRNA formyltransferase [Thermoanaerobaculia bacterium]